MERFQNTKDKTFSFSSCNICEAKCCDGLKNTVMNEIVLEEFEMIAPNFPILFVKGSQGYLKPVVMLSNGKGFCRYIKDFKCTIYNERPSVCRLYPLAPNILNEIHIDISCPAVNEKGLNIIENEKVNKSFDHEKLYNYQDRYLDTFEYFEKLNKDENLTEVLNINNIKFYKFINNQDEKYVKIHLNSLKNLDSYFL